MAATHLSRILLITGFVIVLAVTQLTRKRATESDSAVKKRTDHIASRFGVRITSALTALAIVVYTLNPELLAWSSFQTSTSVIVMGAIVGTLGTALAVWSYHCLGMNWSDTVQTNAGQRLITRGPYRCVRHPLYTSFGLLILGTIFITGNWLIGLLGLSIMPLLFQRALLEERYLEAKFGEDYREYVKQSGRFLPKECGRRSE